MASFVSNAFRNGNMGNPNGTTTTVDFDADDIRWALIDDTDLTSPAGPPAVTWDDWADYNQGTLVADGTALSGKTVGTAAVGAFDATDYVFSSVTGDDADNLTLRKYDATDANSTVILNHDSAITGLPVSPNGGDITVTHAVGGIVQI